MGLFDRLLGNRPSGVKIAGQEPAKAKKDTETFFLDADASSTLGDVTFMRRSNTIRRTFPGNADSPGDKEMVAEVASMESKLEKMTPGLAGINPDQGTEVDLTGGIPKAVKKTFAQPLSQSQLDQRMKGAAVAVNAASTAGPARKSQGTGTDSQPTITNQPAKPGAIDPFKAMAKDLNG